MLGVQLTEKQVVDFSLVGFGDIDAFEVFQVPVADRAIGNTGGKSKILRVVLERVHDLPWVVETGEHLVGRDVPDFECAISAA